VSVALSHAVHTYAKPETKERLLEFYTTVLGLEANAIPWVVSQEPMYAFKFSNGAMLSVEFTADALDDERARGCAWFEIAADDPDDLINKAEALGVRRATHAFPPFGYIPAPGGQVFRIVSSKEASTRRAKERGIGVERPR